VILRWLILREGLEGEIIIRNYSWTDFVLEAMLDGEVDAAVGTPALAVASSQAIGARILIPPNKIWPNNPSYGIITSNKQIEENPKTLEGFLRLHEEASNLIRSDPKKAARIVSEAVKIVDEDFVLETYKISPKYCASLSKGFIKASLAFIPPLKKLKYISQTPKEEAIFDPRLIEKIHPEAPHYKVSKTKEFKS
jgi:NitT/TauT family transport system substrate-binding protein